MIWGVVCKYAFTVSAGIKAPAVTFLPLPPANSAPLARFSELKPLNSKYFLALEFRMIHRHALSVAFTIMFMP